MTDRREQVFVSSTYVDLLDERQQVIQTLLEADCIPSGMELFPASDDDSWTLIKRVIDDCDYYVLLIGGRYGSVNPRDDIGYTEQEYDYALAQSKPIMAFLHGAPSEIPLGKSETDPSLADRLASFRQKAQEKNVKFWTDPRELSGLVAKSLIQIRKTHPAMGWVRADRVVTPELEREIAELRAGLAEERAASESARAELTQALAQPPVDTEDLAQGEDHYDLPVFLTYWAKEGGSKLVELEYDVTWNALFKELGPLMLNEATELDLDKKLDSFAYQVLLENVEGVPEDYKSLRKCVVAANVIHDMVVQFFALGLIRESERRHGVNDANTYWSLSRFGRDRLMRLRAIRRGAGTTIA